MIPAADFAPGTVLGERYRIVSVLGRGEMREVYRAEDLMLGDVVALNFLPRYLATDPARDTQLIHEVRIGRQVLHSNVCRIHDIGEVNGRHYLSMEYIDVYALEGTKPFTIAAVERTCAWFGEAGLRAH